jgi:hypothetical protein
VTALCAKLAYLPHPFTHEYLLNPTIPLTAGSRNLFTALQTAIERGLIATRSMGHVQVSEFESLRPKGQTLTPGAKLSPGVNLSPRGEVIPWG